MSWGARSVRAAALSLLAVGWALAGHLWAAPAGSTQPHGAGHVITGPALATATALAAAGTLAIAAALLPRPRAGLLHRAGRVGLVLGAGQLLTHVAASVAPLLLDPGRPATHGHGPSAGMPVGHGHHLPAEGLAADGLPDLAALLAAAMHGGLPMLLAHLATTVAAALAWALAGVLWQAAADWLDRIVPRPLPAPPDRHASLPAPPEPPGMLPPTFSWDGRGPPRPAAPPPSALSTSAFSRRFA